MQLKKVFMYVFAACMVASCTNDVDFDDIITEQDGDMVVTVEVEPYVRDSGTQTRAYFTDIDEDIDDKNFGFKFKAGDVFGIYSVDGSLNEPLPIKAKSAFKAGSAVNLRLVAALEKSLEDGKEYVLYYPYSEDGKKGVHSYFQSAKQLRFSFSYSGQKQKDNDNSDIIANERNYYVSAPFKYNKGASNPFMGAKLKPLGSVIHFRVNLPEGEYVRVGLENVGESRGFHNSVYASLDENGFNFFPNVNEATWRMPELLLKLEDVYATVDDDEDFGVCDFYMTTYPCNTGYFRIKVTNSEGITYYSSESYSLDMKAGKCYLIDDVELEYPNEEGHEYVDLGLPSGLKWAKMNLGATSTTEYGNYYAWGETKGYGEEDRTNDTNHTYNGTSWVKTHYDWNTYKWCGGTENSISKYNSIDNKSILEPEDDAAIQNWGGRWRTPTYREFQELIDNCFWLWTENYMNSGIRGYIVYEARCKEQRGEFSYGDEENVEAHCGQSIDRPHIFLPVGGLINERGHSYDGNDYLGWGTYMSTSCGLAKTCCCLSFWIYGCDRSLGSVPRTFGVSVRPVFSED